MKTSCRASASGAEALTAAVSRVQRAVAGAETTQTLYRAIIDGVVQLLGADSASLRIVDRADPAWMVAVADHGCDGVRERWRVRAPVSEGVSGRVISTGKLVHTTGADSAVRRSRLAPPGTRAVLGVPILERGKVIGALIASSMKLDSWPLRECETLSSYAEHVSVALAVAHASHEAAQAVTDPLTGLANRPFLLDRLEYKLAQADRGGRPVSLLFLDLDGFKLVNDSLGHVLGDELLVAVAERIRRCTREDDVTARLGGDEFAVLLWDDRAAQPVARRIIGALAQPFVIDGHEMFVRVSVGLANGREEAETLLRNADVAMYAAKRAGGGTLALFQPSMHAARLSRLDTETRLRHAAGRGELELHYQPIFDLGSGTIAAFEGLLRWRRPGRGLIAPAEFVPLAEETGMITELDRWVLAEAARQLALWRRVAPIAVSVNVSVRDLQQPKFVEAIAAELSGEFPPSALFIEITETVALQDSAAIASALRAVKELGVRVALDDFGTGYSSLLSLAQLPVDVLKIAQPFVELAGAQGGAAAGLLAGIIDVGGHLGITTVAEGIENEAQRRLLEELGCELGQGYLLGRPMPAADAERLLELSVRPSTVAREG